MENKSKRGGEEKGGGEEPEDGPKQICVHFVGVSFLFLRVCPRFILGICVYVCVCVEVCETLTALQGLFAPR